LLYKAILLLLLSRTALGLLWRLLKYLRSLDRATLTLLCRLLRYLGLLDRDTLGLLLRSLHWAALRPLCLHCLSGSGPRPADEFP